jgi:hypothetical protein
LAKKKTRKQQYQAQQRASASPVSVPAAGAGTPAMRVTAAAAAPVVKPAADLGKEYQYVISDLKRIGITAASMFALLVVLALLLT